LYLALGVRYDKQYNSKESDLGLVVWICYACIPHLHSPHLHQARRMITEKEGKEER
jgi:hypothetical protein